MKPRQIKCRRIAVDRVQNSSETSIKAVRCAIGVGMMICMFDLQNNTRRMAGAVMIQYTCINSANEQNTVK